MEKCSFFNSVAGDRKYKAEDWADYFATFIGNGVFPYPEIGLQAIANGTMGILVKAGKAWINGYYYSNTSDLSVAFGTADGVLARIDRVVVRWNLTTREIAMRVKGGTPSANPVAAALQRDADIYELAIADVWISAGATIITQANITDRRTNSALCGLATGFVNQIDATALFAQFTDAFHTWFAGVENTLSGDTAGNLLNMIHALDDDLQAAIDALTAVINTKENQTTIVVNMQWNPPLGTVSHNMEYRCIQPSILTAPSFTIPEIASSAIEFAFSVVYKAPNTAAPVITNQSGYSIKYKGDGVEEGQFVPEIGTMYRMSFILDGVFLNCFIVGVE